MSAYPTPPQQFQTVQASRRPGTATAGAIIAIVMSSLTLAGSLIGAIIFLTNRYAIAVLDFAGATGTVVVFALIGISLCAVGLAAGIQTLRNFNAWRITTIVFGFLVGVLSLLGAIGNFSAKHSCIDSSYYSSCADSSGNAGGGVVSLIWAALAFTSAILLLINGANQFYANARVQQFGYAPAAYAQTAPVAQAPTSTPAGWYPVDGGQLRWWDGSAWTDHFHTQG